ncbi:MAG TPA: NYN domain-containing protein, partial [Thermoanaerobaculia bacterium]
MNDETIPFPAAEEGAGADKKPRRRRGGTRRHKSRGNGNAASAEEPRTTDLGPVAAPALAPAAPIPAPAAPMLTQQSSVSPMSVSPGPPSRQNVEQRLSIFIDFENIALGARDAKYKKFDIHLVLQRLIEKGRIVYKKAYADWTRYSEYKREFHEAAIELIDIPQRNYTGKNSADIRMVVDAMDLANSKTHITTFVICSGDSDFSPLVSKLKENDKNVIGVGVKNSTSELLITNCDEFIFYEDLVRETRELPSIENLPEKKRELFRLMLDSIQALQRENYDVIWGSMIKQTMQRKQPYFNETYYGYKSFSELLEDAARLKLVSMKKDAKS